MGCSTIKYSYINFIWYFGYLGSPCNLIRNFSQLKFSLIVTIILAIIFTNLQICEYLEADFGLSDGIYGSTFYLTTVYMDFMLLLVLFF